MTIAATDPKAAEDRQGLEVLTTQRCLQLISEAKVGRVAFVDGGQPVILPVNHVLDGHAIAFRTAIGSKLHAAARSGQFAFEVDGWSVFGRHGWSVLVTGTADEILDDDDIARLESYGLEAWADAIDRPHWIRIRADEISGRRIPRAGAML